MEEQHDINENTDAESSAPPQEQPPQEESSSKGPVVGIVIVLIILIAGAFYVWSTRPDTPPQPVPLPEDTQDLVEADSTTQALEEQSDSDAIDAIEGDLEDTELDNLDQELSDIDQELEDLL